MKSYEKQIQELGYEIADDMIRNENDPSWEMTLEKNKIARSLSTIYSKGLLTTTDDLERSIRKSLNSIKNSKIMG